MADDRKVRRRDLLKAGALAGTACVSAAAASACSGGAGDPDGPPLAAASDTVIVRYAVHPAVGIARVGNSETEYFIAPELPGELPEPEGGFKDANGAIKRQVCRFRIYGYNAAGIAVKEITADDGEITWHVHVANRKASWYRFETALDIPEAKSTFRRNERRTVRKALQIDAGEHSISGREQSGVILAGEFLQAPVTVGELRTDARGRLLFFGGHGGAYNPRGARLVTFADNDGWVDDVADGPVRATVRIGDQVMEAEPGWVASAPPNFGPSIRADFVTLYDIMEDVMVDTGRLPQEEVVSFTAHILPLLLRITDLQWVNQGALMDYGYGSGQDLDDPKLLKTLSSPESTQQRLEWFRRFRNPDYAKKEPDKLPHMYGDFVLIGEPDAETPRQWLAPTRLQYERLRKWSEGQFIDDLDLEASVPSELEALPVPQQPHALDRAAVEPADGGAFHPGTELTWPMRRASMYGGLFRLNLAPRGELTNEVFGTRANHYELTPEQCLGENGPLYQSGPGDLTRWMATLWMTDTASCRSGYDPTIHPYLPTFWPARVPNGVLTERLYDIVMDKRYSVAERREAFSVRPQWLRGVIRRDYLESLRIMVKHWPQLGFVTLKPGPGDEVAPAIMKVETEAGFEELTSEESGDSVLEWADAVFGHHKD